MKPRRLRSLLVVAALLGCGHPPFRYIPPAYANDAGIAPDTDITTPALPPMETTSIHCPLRVEHAGVVLARVGSEVITACDVAVAWEARTREGYESDNLHAVLLDLVDQALRASVATTPTPDPAVDRVLADAVLRADALSALASERPGEAAITRFYNNHHDDFSVPERVHLREVVLPTRGAAEAVARALASGSPFESLVTQTIDANGRRDGGDLGYLPRTGAPGLAQAIVTAGFALAEPGDISAAPLQVMTEVPARHHTRRVIAWHVVQLLQRLPAEEISLADARRRILHRMTEDRYMTLRREARARWTERLQHSVHEAINEAALRRVRVTPR